MHILIVGNILKDVYLGLDPRSGAFESDKRGVSWLDLSFDASTHHFFTRTSSFAGAAISLEVLKKLGLDASISGSRFTFDDDGPVATAPAKAYRYILVHDDNVSYLTSTSDHPSLFEEPSAPVDYLYLDRSAKLDEATASKIAGFTEENPRVKLVLYVKNPADPVLQPLIEKAALIFLEEPVENSQKPAISAAPEKIIHLSETAFSYQNLTEPISVDRIDTLTHLSAFSIAAATILGSFILGEPVENSLKLAKLNVENSTLSATLSKSELENLRTTAKPTDNLELIAASLVLKKKGILAADESGGSIKKKFLSLNIPDTFENRHAYRDIFFTTANLEDYVSGVILFDETARDRAATGQTYVDFLTSKRIIPGIKVDQGLEVFNDAGETYTKGLENLEERLKEYYGLGLRFAKWRAAFNLTVSDTGEILTPSAAAIGKNCDILASYAKKCQSAGLVPIVEPEVVYDGYFTIENCAAATARILDRLFEKLSDYGVNLKACILKVNMILAGKKMHTQTPPEKVGYATANVLKNHVPEDLAGVVFLSGGQTAEQATANLAAVIKNGPFPWPVTFSFARALQDPALFAWQGRPENVEAAKKAFEERLKNNSLALNI